jgi:rhodanese-related sulfurtransferase
MQQIKALIKSGKATVVDVRSAAEFMGGHVAGSLNIPLQEIPARLAEFKSMSHVVLCCASGNRSGQAMQYLTQQGIACENAGSWVNLKD